MKQTDFIKDYMDFLSKAKTERLAVSEAEKLAIRAGFRRLDYTDPAMLERLKPGSKVYCINRDKNFLAAVIGKNPSKFNILGAHIDSPRLDVKTKPLYENGDVAYFDLQYYGGIKKYQWTTIPLAIHGSVYRVDENGYAGETVVNIGDDPEDPVFCITDLLPHLDKKLSDRTGDKVIAGEDLDIILATSKVGDKDAKEPVKEWVKKALNDKYGITEDDLYSAELEVVPAGPARYCGLDKSLIAGYGQDDRVCAYTSLRALIDLTEIPEDTAVCFLVDKEEIGSCGATGTDSVWFENVLKSISKVSDFEFPFMLERSKMLSSDVTAAYDPLHGEVSNKEMTAKLGGGLMFSKYNGGRGKGGGADANPQFIAQVRAMMNKSEVKYQFDTMGKVDVGGGGTIASMICRLNMDVLDAGVPVLNMHSPMELTHVDDIWNAYLGYSAFIK